MVLTNHVDLKTQQRLVFIHLPKTAGKYITNVFKSQFPDSECLIFLFDDIFLKKIKNCNVSNLHFFAGHLSVRYIDTIPSPKFIFTFLREPVDRILSSYWYWRQEHPEAVIGEFPKEKLTRQDMPWDLDLMRILSDERDIKKYKEIKNAQAAQLADSIHERTIFDDRKLAEKAIEFIVDKLSYEGLYNQLEEDIQSILKLNNLKVAADNKVVNPTLFRKYRNDCSSELLQMIESTNKADFMVYNHVLNHKNRG